MLKPLKHYFGFDSFKGRQEEVIRHLLDGNDCFVLMPTGGGKSLCYQLPSLIMPGTAIVISPLIALMKNQVDVINGISEHNGVAHCLNSSMNRGAIDQVKNDIKAGTTKLLYMAPESLQKEEYINFLKTVKVSFSSLLPPHTMPLGRPSAPAPSIQYRASNLDWRLVPYEIGRASCRERV